MKMTKMDPWTSFDNVNKSDHKVESTFEDNFSPISTDNLPDSEEYLAKLEQRLNKIKTDPNVLKQLSEKREACMYQLLNGTYEEVDSLNLNDPVENSSLLRTIAPHKQALTQGELVELVKYDQLSDKETEEISTTKEDPPCDSK